MLDLASDADGRFLALVAFDEQTGAAEDPVLVRIAPPNYQAEWAFADLDADGRAELCTMTGARQGGVAPIVHVWRNLGGLHFAP